MNFPCCEFKKGLWKTRLRPGEIIEICHACLEEERKPKDEVEEEILLLTKQYSSIFSAASFIPIKEVLEKDLRKLVALARKT